MAIRLGDDSDQGGISIRPLGHWAAALVCIAASASAPAPAAAAISNPGFEDGLAGWSATAPTAEGAVGLKGKAHSGEQAAQLPGGKAFVSQMVALEPGQSYRLTAFLSGVGTLGVKVGGELYFEQQAKSGRRWRALAVIFPSGSATSATVFGSAAGRAVLFDDFRLELLATEPEATSARVRPRSAGGSGLSPDLPPGRNFDLLDWYLSIPVDDDGDGKADRLSERELAAGATDPRFFYTAHDGGMVLRATVAGARTSQNTKFTRTELREMLRRGDTSISTRNDDQSPNANNWVFSSAPAQAQREAGAVDGVLQATLAVNRVTTTGSRNQVGRVVIGQIHAGKDEPIRLYYRKLPHNTRGAVYAAHERSGGGDIWHELIGSRTDSAADPAEGIALDEVFSYEIRVKGNLLDVSISQHGQVRAAHQFDMTDSGYDVANDYMYFKAGVYNQNNSGDPDDAVQATFYALDNGHDRSLSRPGPDRTAP